jgi:SlyX protein
MDDERLVDIEIKLARQEDLLDTLNSTVYRQQRRIDELEALCSLLARRIAEAGQGNGNGGDGLNAHEPPPHY